ncbi:MAG TPA: EAL domain-containing protein [Thermoanaerobaculia bacterium]|nr:EAL domain-containing protein [Thermoanaerobaculia bacterium]
MLALAGSAHAIDSTPEGQSADRGAAGDRAGASPADELSIVEVLCLDQILRWLESEPFDVLALSYPALGGGASAADELVRIVEWADSLPVVVVSGPAETEPALALLRAGAHEVLVADLGQQDALVRPFALAVQRYHLDRAARRSHERSTLALECAGEGIWEWDPLEGRLFVSSQFHALIGGEGALASVPPSWWLRRIHAEDRRRFHSLVRTHLGGKARGEPFECEHRLLHRSGEHRWILARGLARFDRRGRVRRLVGTVSDVTARRSASEQLLHEALHDTLTGLPNRSLFLDRLAIALAQLERRTEHRFAVLFLDLDRFKQVNDSLGHERGDQLLAQVARRLESLIRPSDRVARFGGDEFAVLADGLVGVEDANLVAVRLIERLSEPYDLEGHRVRSTVSMGVCLSDPHYREPEAMLRDADRAMYRIKARGGNGFELFDPTGDSAARGELALETELRAAVERGELEVEYQPIVELTGGRITGFEALVRWNHPRRGRLAPAEFVPVAERSGMIHRIGEFVLQSACRQVADWQRRYPRSSPLSISVNVSGRELLQGNLVERVASQIRDSGLSPGSLRLEITESSVMVHTEAAIDQLESLRDLDVELDLDDFGTGYCSLSYLQRIPTGTLKIDRSFVGKLGEGGTTGHIVEAIVKLAHQLGLRVSAEGLENEDQLRYMRRLACTHGQGYYFSASVRAAVAEAWLEADCALLPN